MNADGSGVTRLTDDFDSGAACWIAYYIYEVTRTQLWLMNPDGSGEVPLTPPWALGRPSSVAWRP
ncbi:MAG TPA: hypothetical protein VHR41_06870 [Gemmatimonadales bacterium]|jgi:hypothetical protein|nr:hypothetical protein [Gemmatimonadales bacterium]